VLWVRACRFRRELESIGCIPGLELGWGEPPSSLAHVVRTGHIAAAHEATLPRSPLLVAVDASVGSGRPGVGIACVDENGRYRQKFLTNRMSSNLAELEAVALAVDTFPGRPLHILTDSKWAAGESMRQEAIPGFSRIAALVASGDLTVEWVKGHSGHPLNEAAHRLCMAARRRVELGQSPAVLDAIAQQIVGDYLNVRAALTVA
jgi:ribonuclease HI